MNTSALSVPSAEGASISTSALLAVAHQCMPLLTQGKPITTNFLQAAMTEQFGGSDASGAWCWKQAYEAVETALVQFVQTYRPALSKLPAERLLAAVERLHGLCPTHTKRSEQSVAMQQFSTPFTIGLLAMQLADIKPGDNVLEPSAGTGMLAVLAELRGASLILNELCDTRYAILEQLFANSPHFQINGEYLHDYMDSCHVPDVVLMNPPFSTSPNGSGNNTIVSYHHIMSALRRLKEGGRLVAITGESFSPYTAKWRKSFEAFQQLATLRASIPLASKLYYKHGTSIETRIHLFEKETPVKRDSFPESAPMMPSAVEALHYVHMCNKTHVYISQKSAAQLSLLPTTSNTAKAPAGNSQIITLDVGKKPQQTAASAQQDGIYLPYATQTLAVEGAKPHPSPLVESAALASVAPPYVGYSPTLYAHLVTEGILSEAQLESIIYAGAAHHDYLAGHFKMDESGLSISVVPHTDPAARQYRRGWYLGDGTGCGKGRQVAGIILDNWLKGRRRAFWVSKSDKLIEDARRDWVALGGNELDIIPQSKFKLGESINIPEGILFTTYATLRTAANGKKRSRLEQITDWLGDRFDGCIMFDEAHAMANAIDTKGDRGMKEASQQGLCGLKLQYALPDARIVYVSATGATTVSNLAYATRLGLWGTEDMPFASQSDFIAEMERGGIAAMEVIARDLKSMGLYMARSLSYEGVEYEFLNHELTEEQIEIYNAYAEAFQVIHHNIEAALEATNITGTDGSSHNKNAKAAARSAFESNKQRFFNHLLMGMKCPSLIKAMETDLAEGRSAVIQVVSTNEALMERRLAEIPASEWQDLQIDITPREYVFDYLMHAFPIYLHEVFYNEDGKPYSELARDAEGNPVICRAALEKRDALIEKLATLPAIPGALDQIIHHFGHEMVAEATGRSRRVIKVEEHGTVRYCIQNRSASANTAETQAFMDGKKLILVFSDAGGTGHSYHADRNCLNQRKRVHYLLEPGWEPKIAVQGLGRTNRTNQTSTPIFRPVASNVKGEKRFLSTIARRLDTLGAMTKGQRETGTQGIFRPEDNLESDYARAALRNLLRDIAYNNLDCCNLGQFEAATGLSLMQKDGGLKEQLPPISQFLNRLLALPIYLQNDLFEAFELRIAAKIEAAKEAGTYEQGLEMLRAESFALKGQTVLQEYGNGQAGTICNHIIQRDPMRYLSADAAIARVSEQQGMLVKNAQSGRVAIQFTQSALDFETGSMVSKVILQRPATLDRFSMADYRSSSWEAVNADTFRQLWEEEVAAAPKERVTEFYLISGVLLPVWKKLSKDNLRVCRLITDDGISLLGRVVMPIEIGSVYSAFGLDASAVVMSAADILARVRNEGKAAPLGNGLLLRSSSIMGIRRMEVTEFDAGQIPKLNAAGCKSEIIGYKMRYFVADNEDASEVITQLQAIV